MIHASIRMKFGTKEISEASLILRSLVERTRISSGCLGCNLFQDVQEDGVLLYEQWWEREKDLGRHIRSDLYRQVILVMEMANEFPVVQFSEISLTTGMETIRKYRSVAESHFFRD